MARYSYSGRGTVEAARRVELSVLKKLGFFPRCESFINGNIRWSQNGEPTGNIMVRIDTRPSESYLQLVYKTREHGASSDDPWRDYDYRFPLEGLLCRYGGYKWYVRCQLAKAGIFCGRRVRILYMVGDYFGCRHCANLTYQSCRDNGFISIPDVDAVEAKVKRMYYAGKPTKQYKRFLRINERFENSFLSMAFRLRLGESRKK